MVYTVLPPWWCSRRTFGRSRGRRGLGELGLRQGATEREEERCEEKRGSGMAFYSRSAGAPREVCTASMAEFPRRHWPEWRCRRADVVLQELGGITACVGEAVGAREKAGKA